MFKKIVEFLKKIYFGPQIDTEDEKKENPEYITYEDIQSFTRIYK